MMKKVEIIENRKLSQKEILRLSEILKRSERAFRLEARRMEMEARR